MDLAFITIILQLIFLECILSIDNAAVLGAMVAPPQVALPTARGTIWPQRLGNRAGASTRSAAAADGEYGPCAQSAGSRARPAGRWHDISAG